MLPDILSNPSSSFTYLTSEIISSDTMFLFWNTLATAFIIGLTLALLFKVFGWRLF